MSGLRKAVVQGFVALAGACRRRERYSYLYLYGECRMQPKFSCSN
jgi:hypothetical protein